MERRRDYPEMLERLKNIELLLRGNGKIGVSEMARMERRKQVKELINQLHKLLKEGI